MGQPFERERSANFIRNGIVVCFIVNSFKVAAAVCSLRRDGGGTVKLANGFSSDRLCAWRVVLIG